MNPWALATKLPELPIELQFLKEFFPVACPNGDLAIFQFDDIAFDRADRFKIDNIGPVHPEKLLGRQLLFEKLQVHARQQPCFL